MTRPGSSIAAQLLVELGPFGGAVPDPDGEPWDDLVSPRADRRITHLIAGSTDASVIVWTQKIHVAEWIWPATTPPAHVFGHYGPPDEAAIDLAACLSPARVIVLTDLDPWGWFLAQLVTRAFALRGVATVHRGIDDALIAFSASWRSETPPGDPLDSVTIVSSPVERARWACMRARAVEHLGPRARAVLDGGRRLELEAVTNPSLHREGYAAALATWIVEAADLP